MTPEEAFWYAFWDAYFEATPVSETHEEVRLLLGISVLTYVVLSYLFVVLPWQRIITKAGFKGRVRSNLRFLMWSSPILGPLTLLSGVLPLFLALYLLMPLAGFLWLAFAPWPVRQQATAQPEPKTEPKSSKPKLTVKRGEIDMLKPGVWVVRCADGAYWIREEELARLDLPLAIRLGKMVKFVPIPGVKIPQKLVGQITGVVRNGLTQVVA